MAYDAFDGYVVYFGGRNANGPLGETWLFSGAQWINETPFLTRSPPPTWGAVMDYDAVFHAILLYGGCGRTVCPENYTWYYTGASGWTNLTAQLSPASPPLRDAALAYASDPMDGFSVLYGGCQDANCSARSNATYAFDGFGWIALPTVASPPPFDGASLSYDPAIGQTVLLGGCPDGACSTEQVWTFVNYAWQNRTPPSGLPTGTPTGRAHAVVTWDELDQELVLFGGASGPQLVNDTWALQCTSYGCGWQNLSIPGNEAPLRSDAAVASTSNATIGTVFFGGMAPANASDPANTTKVPSNATFALDPPILLSPTGPGPRPARSAIPVEAHPSGGSGSYAAFAGNYTVTWRGPGVFEQGASVVLNFSEPGTYNLTVTAFDRFGAEVQAPFSVQATGPQSTIVGGTAAYAGVSVPFSATAASGGTAPYLYTWAFGDGQGATGTSVNHTWGSTGGFTVTLVVVDAMGLIYQTTRSLHVYLAPTVTVQADRSVVDVGQTVAFTSQIDGLGGPANYSWSFGPTGATATSANASYRYGAPGVYTATLIVENASLLPVSGSVTVTVHPALRANGTVSPGIARVGEVTTFGVAVTGGTPPYSVTWLLGDGGVETGPNVTHTYARSGTFAVSAWVNDSVGGSTLVTVAVTIVAPPAPGSTPGTVDPWLLLAGIGAGAAVVGGVVIWRRRRGSGPARSDPDRDGAEARPEERP